jgi:hypothetical protein
MEAQAFVLLAFLAIALYISSLHWAALIQFTSITVALAAPPQYRHMTGIAVLSLLTLSIFWERSRDSDMYPAILLALCAGLMADQSALKNGP